MLSEQRFVTMRLRTIGVLNQNQRTFMGIIRDLSMDCKEKNCNPPAIRGRIKDQFRYCMVEERPIDSFPLKDKSARPVGFECFGSSDLTSSDGVSARVSTLSDLKSIDQGLKPTN